MHRFTIAYGWSGGWFIWTYTAPDLPAALAYADALALPRRDVRITDEKGNVVS